MSSIYLSVACLSTIRCFLFVCVCLTGQVLNVFFLFCLFVCLAGEVFAPSIRYDGIWEAKGVCVDLCESEWVGGWVDMMAAPPQETIQIILVSTSFRLVSNMYL